MGDGDGAEGWAIIKAVCDERRLYAMRARLPLDGFPPPTCFESGTARTAG